MLQAEEGQCGKRVPAEENKERRAARKSRSAAQKRAARRELQYEGTYSQGRVQRRGDPDGSRRARLPTRGVRRRARPMPYVQETRGNQQRLAPHAVSTKGRTRAMQQERRFKPPADRCNMYYQTDVRPSPRCERQSLFASSNGEIASCESASMPREVTRRIAEGR